jgi:hypothetical protein
MKQGKARITGGLEKSSSRLERLPLIAQDVFG